MDLNFERALEFKLDEVYLEVSIIKEFKYSRWQL